MRILALDTSQLQAVVCVLDQGKVLASEVGTTSVAHSESILPLIDTALKKAGSDLRSMQAFACGVGPGSFTGLRIGCATIKAFAQAQNCKVLPVSSLRALVHSATAGAQHCVALVNAYQGQAFLGYLDAKGNWQEEAVLPVEWFSKNASLLKHSTTVVGSGVKAFQSKIEEELKIKLKTDSTEFITPQGLAASVAEALTKPDAFVSHENLVAHYMKVSAAEEKWQQTQGKS